MVGLVIGASDDSIHAIKCAQKMGIYVIALDGNREAEGLKIADKSIVIDIRDGEQLCKVIRDTNPTLTIPVPIGRYLTTTGYVNEYFNLKGVNNRAAKLCTDKYLFHKKLNEQGLREINSYLIRKKSDYIDKNFDYPVIIKPRYGSGSRQVALINNKQELLMKLGVKDILDEDFIIEDAVDGIEYGIDGAVLDGELQITLVRKKIITSPPARQCVGYLTGDIEENNELFKRIQLILKKAINHLSINNCIFHGDLIINDNNIFIIEISGRPSGHYLHNTFTPYVTDIDMISEYIKYIKFGKGNFLPNKSKVAAIHFFNFENCVVKYIPSFEKLKKDSKCNIIDFRCNIKEGDILESVDSGKSIIGRGYFIVRGKNEKNLLDQIDKILNSFVISKLER